MRFDAKGVVYSSSRLPSGAETRGIDSGWEGNANGVGKTV